jgi:hypothetical protein
MNFLTGISATTWFILAGCGLFSIAVLILHHSTIKNEDNRIIVRTENHLNKIKGIQNAIINSTPNGHAVAVRMRRRVF